MQVPFGDRKRKSELRTIVRCFFEARGVSLNAQWRGYDHAHMSLNR
jgi:hypothetical protein